MPVPVSYSRSLPPPRLRPRSPHPPPRPRAHARPRARPRSAATDSELVHRAAKALRHDGDPALRSALSLEAHRAQSAAGRLAEEALSLEIEAAIELRSARAATLAREYLSRYPDGRYAAVARRALSDAAP